MSEVTLPPIKPPTVLYIGGSHDGDYYTIPGHLPIRKGLPYDLRVMEKRPPVVFMTYTQGEAVPELEPHWGAEWYLLRWVAGRLGREWPVYVAHKLTLEDRVLEVMNPLGTFWRSRDGWWR